MQLTCCSAILINSLMDGQVDGRPARRAYKQEAGERTGSEGTDGTAGDRTDERVEHGMDGDQTNRQTGGKTDGLTDKWTDGLKGGLSARRIWMDGLMDGPVDEVRMDG